MLIFPKKNSRVPSCLGIAPGQNSSKIQAGRSTTVLLPAGKTFLYALEMHRDKDRIIQHISGESAHAQTLAAILED
jgi:hypothetical protein